MVKSITLDGYTYRTGLKRHDIDNIMKAIFPDYSIMMKKESFAQRYNNIVTNFEKIDSNHDLELSEKEIVKYKNKRIVKGVLIGLGIVAGVSLMAYGLCKGISSRCYSSSSSSSSSNSMMSREEFGNYYVMNNYCTAKDMRTQAEEIQDAWNEYVRTGRIW